MNDEALRKRIIALGLVYEDFYLAARIGPAIRPTNEEFVRDWQVAGALMEKVGNGFGYVLVVDKWLIEVADEEDNSVMLACNKSLPRAIIEACVEALKAD